MAWDDEYNVPEDWNSAEIDMYGDFVDIDERIGEDQYLQELFHEALFHDIHGHGGPEHDFLMDQLAEYLLNEYDLLFDEIFDWEGWREWYEGG